MATILPVSILLILIAIGVHYEALAFGSRWLGKLSIAPRIRVLLGVLLTLCAHFVEVVLFAVGWYYLLVTDMAILSAGWGSCRLPRAFECCSASFTYLEMQRHWYERDED